VKKVKMISAALIIMLATVMFGMSGDGGNVPVVQKEATVNVSSQVSPQGEKTQTTNSDPVNTRDTVKDQFGIDTGLTKEEIYNLRNDYERLAEKLEIPKGRNGFKSLFEGKKNLNAYNELKQLGVDLKNYGAPNHATSHLENTLNSRIVILGEITDVVYVEDQKFFNSYFKVKAFEFIKGKEYIKDELVDHIQVLSKNGKKVSFSDTTPLQIGDKVMFFLDFLNENDNHFSSISLSERFIINNQLYSNSKNTLIGDLSSEIAKMKEIIKLNDSENFYKRSYRKEE